MRAVFHLGGNGPKERGVQDAQGGEGKSAHGRRRGGDIAGRASEESNGWTTNRSKLHRTSRSSFV